MNNLEQQLIDIDERMADAIRKQKLSVAETIHKVAEDSINACRNLDDEFRDIFPELAELESSKLDKKQSPKTYRKISKTKTIPLFVIEIKDGDGINIIDNWNNMNILPNRKVIGKYFIDCGYQYPWIFMPSFQDNYCKTHKCKCDIIGEFPKKYSLSCGCIGPNFDTNILPFLTQLDGDATCNFPSIRRGEDRPLFHGDELEFEVDNYLNLYHPQSKLYLLFNRTAFPKFPFLARPNIFKSKRISDRSHNMKFKLDPEWYCNIDARPDILAAVPELIPDDYYKVIDFYLRFKNRLNCYERGFIQIGSNHKYIKTTIPNIISSRTEDIDIENTTDTRDKLIRELESRLSGCLKQIELTDEYNRELVDLFAKQSAEVLDLTRRLNQQTADKQTTETAKRLAENQEIFALKKQLADAQSYIARCQMLGGDIARLETELTDSKLETQKYKDLAQGLTDQLLCVKRELRDKSAEHAAGIKTSTRDMSRIAGLEKDNSRLTQDNLAAQSKIRDLEAKVLAGNINSKPEKEALEQVLITKCDELTRDRDELSRKYSELVKANKQLERDYEEFRGSITRLMTGAK